MSDPNVDPRERDRALLMKALDGELSHDERREFERSVADDANLRAEFLRLRNVKEITGVMRYRQPPEEVWEGYWTSVYNRFERGVGWVLLSLGATVLAGFGLWQAVQALFADSEVPLLLRLALFGGLLGGAILSISVVREKWVSRRADPYKEIRR